MREPSLTTYNTTMQEGKGKIGERRRRKKRKKKEKKKKKTHNNVHLRLGPVVKNSPD